MKNLEKMLITIQIFLMDGDCYDIGLKELFQEIKLCVKILTLLNSKPMRCLKMSDSYPK